MKELVLLIGSPGAGKSTYCREKLEGYTRINQDDQGPHGQWVAFEKALKDGDEKIVVDRMHFSVDQRERYTVPARKLGYFVRFIWFQKDFNTCFGQMLGRKDHPTIPHWDYQTMCRAISGYFRHLEEPIPEEYDALEIVK